MIAEADNRLNPTRLITKPKIMMILLYRSLISSSIMQMSNGMARAQGTRKRLLLYSDQ